VTSWSATSRAGWIESSRVVSVKRWVSTKRVRPRGLAWLVPRQKPTQSSETAQVGQPLLAFSTCFTQEVKLRRLLAQETAWR
jgi:hypothetical protein